MLDKKEAKVLFRILISAVCAACMALAQPGPQQLAFEVASVKPSPPFTGGSL
jgi:hypothetical protein